MRHKNDWEKDDLRGKVKKQKIFYYRMYNDKDEFGKYYKKKLGSVERCYDDEGRRRSIHLFDSEGQLAQIMISGYSFCETKLHGNPQVTEEMYFDRSGKHVSSKKYQYQSDKLDYQWTWQFPDGNIAHKRKYIYNNNLLIREEYLGSDDKPIVGRNVDFWNNAKELSKNINSNVSCLERRFSIREYKYNDKGLLIEDNDYIKVTNRPWHKNLYYYNDKHLLIEKREYRGYVLEKELIEVHADGTTTRTSLLDIDKDFCSKYLYKYDESGLKIERKEYDSDLRFKERRIYKYDEQLNVILEERHSPQEKLLDYIKFDYEYAEFKSQMQLFD